MDKKIKHTEVIKLDISRQRVGEFGEGIMIAVATAGFVLSVATLPGLAYAVAPFVKKRKRETIKTKQNIEKSLGALINNGLIKYTKSKDSKYTIELTKKGKLYTLFNNAGFHERTRKKITWDKKWRIVIFDVPETKRLSRDKLREAVIKFGFVQIQKSVWVYPYPCDDFVSLLKHHLGISHDLLYLTADYVENDKELKRMFKLAKK